METQYVAFDDYTGAQAFFGEAAREELDKLVARAFEEDATGGVFGYRWEAAGNTVEPKVTRLATPDQVDITQFNTIIVDAGNSSGDSWKYIYHAIGAGFFIQEA